MNKRIRILLQSTIPFTQDDWTIERFSLLRAYLSSLTNADGDPLVDVQVRNREANATGDDTVLSRLDRRDLDELWLFAADAGNGLTTRDCEAITRFRQSGGGILVARDHQDLGSSICTIGGIGAAHFFHSSHLDPDPSLRSRDDQDTPTVSWPNYHSGRNGDYQRVTVVEPVHELMRNPNSPSGLIEFFPHTRMKGALEYRRRQRRPASLQPASVRNRSSIQPGGGF